MKIDEMVKYFEGVKAQHEVAVKLGVAKPETIAIMKTYDFVIQKLGEWQNGR